MRWKQIKKKCFIGMLLFILVTLLSFTILDYVATLKMETALKLIKKSGEPTTPKDSALKRIPENENAYFFYKRAFAFLRDLEEPSNSKLFIEVCYSVRNVNRTPAWSLKEKEKIKNFLQAHQEVFLYMKKALSRSKCVYPVEWEKGFGAELKHLNQLNHCVFLSLAQALFLMEEEKYEEAVELVAASFHLARSVHSEPSIMSFYTERDLSTQVLNISFWLSRHYEPCRELLFKKFSEFPRLDWHKRWVKTLKAERASIIEIFTELLDGKRGNVEDYFLFGNDTKPLSLIECIYYFFGSNQSSTMDTRIFLKCLSTFPYFVTPFVKLDLVHSLEIMERQISYSNLSLSQAFQSLQRDTASFSQNSFYFLSNQMADYSEYTFKHCLDYVALERSFYLTLAVQSFLTKEGYLPEKLDSLAQSLQVSLEDPHTGKPLLYSKKGKTFSIYSTGVNRTLEQNRTFEQNANGATITVDDIGWKWWNEYPKILDSEKYRFEINSAISHLKNHNYHLAERVLGAVKVRVPRYVPTPVANTISEIAYILRVNDPLIGDALINFEEKLNKLLELIKDKELPEPKEYAHQKLKWVNEIKQAKSAKIKATEAYKNGDYETAITFLTEVISSAEGSEQLEHQEKLKKWKKEYYNVLLTKAKELIEEKQFEEANQLLNKAKDLAIPETEELLQQLLQQVEK